MYGLVAAVRVAEARVERKRVFKSRFVGFAAYLLEHRRVVVEVFYGIDVCHFAGVLSQFCSTLYRRCTGNPITL